MLSTSQNRETTIDPQTIKAIETVLAKGQRVELLRDKDGNIIAQTIERKRLKTE